MPCDLLAVDQAYPAPVADDDVRAAAHQAWQHGQVHLVRLEGRLTLLVPGTDFDAVLTLDALARLTKALGASPEDFVGAPAAGLRTAPFGHQRREIGSRVRGWGPNGAPRRTLTRRPLRWSRA